jgi:hypothetical protein
MKNNERPVIPTPFDDEPRRKRKKTPAPPRRAQPLGTLGGADDMFSRMEDDEPDTPIDDFIRKTDRDIRRAIGLRDEPRSEQQRLAQKLGPTCDGCGQPGASVRYKGKQYHMSCKLSVKQREKEQPAPALVNVVKQHATSATESAIADVKRQIDACAAGQHQYAGYTLSDGRPYRAHLEEVLAGLEQTLKQQQEN